MASATIAITTRAGKPVKRLVTRSGNWSFGPPPPPYYWLRFTCRLKPGLYRIEVRAVDWAGNRQIHVARNWLKVVSKGAPAARPPYWPSGLPDTSQSVQSTALRAASREPVSRLVTRAH